MDEIIKEDCARIAGIVDLTPFRRKRVLITGATGFIGQYIVSLLCYANQELGLNCRITGIGLHAPSRKFAPIFFGKNITFQRADLSKSVKVSGRFDYVFHAAGYGQPAKFIINPLSTVNVNVGATRDLLEIAKKSKGTFCYFSSSEVYGEIPDLAGGINESYLGSIDTTNPRAIYGESKRLGEAIVATYARAHGVRGKIFRISHLYGPGISIYDTRVLGDFIRKALTTKTIDLLDKGEAVKTFGYISDAIAMMMHVALYGEGMIYHIGGKDSVSIKQLAETVAYHTGARVVVPKVKSDHAHIGVDPRFVGLSLKKVLGEMKRFSLIPVMEGLRRTIQWNEEKFKNEIAILK